MWLQYPLAERMASNSEYEIANILWESAVSEGFECHTGGKQVP